MFASARGGSQSNDNRDIHATLSERIYSQTSEVLKVGHHGSAYSSTSEFIDAVDPKYAVISVGRHNLFGHPAPSTIATLLQHGARVYRTDEDGAVSVSTNGESVGVTTVILH